MHGSLPLQQPSAGRCCAAAGCSTAVTLVFVAAKHAPPSSGSCARVILLHTPPRFAALPPLLHCRTAEEGVAKIGDVGMVRPQVSDLVTAQPLMTPLWAAPEVLRRERAGVKVGAG